MKFKLFYDYYYLNWEISIELFSSSFLDVSRYVILGDDPASSFTRVPPRPQTLNLQELLEPDDDDLQDSDSDHNNDEEDDELFEEKLKQAVRNQLGADDEEHEEHEEEDEEEEDDDDDDEDDNEAEGSSRKKRAKGADLKEKRAEGVSIDELRNRASVPVLAIKRTRQERATGVLGFAFLCLFSFSHCFSFIFLLEDCKERDAPVLEKNYG